MKLEFDVQKDNPLKNPLCFRFSSNSPEFIIDYEMSNIIDGYFPHVGISARQGFNILYKQDNNWFNVELYTRESPKTINMRSMIKNFDEEYEILIYGPLLANVDKFSVEVPDSEIINLINTDGKQNALIVGGVHSFGIGCTSQGVMFSNILGRKLDLEIDNLSFNNRNYLKDVFLFLKNNDSLPFYKYVILELDYFNQDDNQVSEYLLRIIDKLIDHCNFLIGWSSISVNKSYKISYLNKLLSENNYDEKMLICDFSTLFSKTNYEKCASSSYFINDTGNIFIFKKLFKVIRGIEKWNF